MALKDSEKRKEYDRARYLKRREQQLIYQREWRASHKEYLRAYFKVYDSTRRTKEARRKSRDPVKARAAEKRYRKRNWAKVLILYRRWAAERRARQFKTTIEKIDYAKVISSANGICGICKKPFDLFGIHIDHIVPLCRGGTHTYDNLQATHARCNQTKWAHTG